jgi:hypothetical protein
MVKMLLIMHHIALCTLCIALVNYGHLLHMQVDHAEPESENTSGANPTGVQRSTSVKWRRY